MQRSVYSTFKLCFTTPPTLHFLFCTSFSAKIFNVGCTIPLKNKCDTTHACSSTGIPGMHLSFDTTIQTIQRSMYSTFKLFFCYPSHAFYFPFEMYLLSTQKFNVGCTIPWKTKCDTTHACSRSWKSPLFQHNNTTKCVHYLYIVFCYTTHTPFSL